MKALLVMVLLSGCTPTPQPVPPPTPDASDAAPPSPGDCAAACQALTNAGCTEGQAVTCISRMLTIERGRLDPNPKRFNLPLTCADVAAVKTAADVHDVGQKCNGQ